MSNMQGIASFKTPLKYAKAQRLEGLNNILVASTYADLCKESQRIWLHEPGSYERKTYYSAYIARLLELNEAKHWPPKTEWKIKDETEWGGAPNSKWVGAWS